MAHFGTIGERYELELNFTHRFDYTTHFNYTPQHHTIYILEDGEGNVFKYDTTGFLFIERVNERGDSEYDAPQEGDAVILKGTVKEHSEYKETPQTVLSRCKLVRINHACVYPEKPSKEWFEERRREAQLSSLKGEDFVWNMMPYKQYKEHYADCETVAGSFKWHRQNAYIDVIIREGRLKASGVRGKHFRGYEFTNAAGQKITYSAVSEENALRRVEKDFPNEGWACTKVYRYERS